MSKASIRLAAVLAVIALTISSGLHAQSAAYETKKISENVYVYRFGDYQSMFVVTPAGVIVTDPIGYLRPESVQTYIAEIRKITQAPVKYVIYSHHHVDHAAGGKPFKDLGATFIAHKNAKTRLTALKRPDVVMPDIAVGDKHTLNLGGVRLDLRYVGRNHSDSTLVMLLPKDKIAFTVDWISPDTPPYRQMPDSYVSEWFTSLDRLLALDWERLIDGHPYAGGKLATKEDVRNEKAFMTDLSAAVKVAAAEGKCWDTAMKEVKLPKYEKWANYERYLPGNVERFCGYWARGID
jgi:glyoxylase-like metal-dependent hydrolase (beta-lactamase superfamily II)